MKSQDILLLLKLVSLETLEIDILKSRQEKYPVEWQDWVEDEEANILLPKTFEESLASAYNVRALSLSTGISKSEISLSLRRCLEIGLAKLDLNLRVPRANTKALYEFIVYGLKYVFPAKMGPMIRGIATGLGAPILQRKVISAGDIIPVWPDVHGKSKGQTLDPLYKTVPTAVRNDKLLYAFLALIDAIRIGHPRERSIAINELSKLFRKADERI